MNEKRKKENDIGVGNEPVNDKEIEASQNVLRRQFSDIKGFQDRCLKDACFEPTSSHSIQIHHAGTCHRVCSVAEKGVYWLDSLFNNKLTPSIELFSSANFGNLECLFHPFDPFHPFHPFNAKSGRVDVGYMQLHLQLKLPLMVWKMPFLPISSNLR